MSGRIEAVLIGTLEQAREAATVAKEAADVACAYWQAIQRDVDHLEELLAHHVRQVAAEPPTQAIPAVPAAEPDHVMPCPACGGQRYQEDEALLHVVNGWDGCPGPEITRPDETPDGA